MTPQEIDLFHEVLEQRPEARAAFIEERFGDEPALAERLRRLVAGHERAEQAGGPTSAFLVDPVPERIGPYQVLEIIGEGGMGVVYAAEQIEPIRRRVAIKVIKLGMDTKHVIARFEAERQALAMLDHPCIARVFDAGSTESGRPYFVMELVRGVPFSTYCTRHKVPLQERLQLYAQVCDAVHHAHQKGIIHRDLKPSNVLIAVTNDRPVPKVIDFGVSKATATQLSDQSVFTEQGQLIGTPEYMSPEQAEMSGLDVDTRTDVYSLGVMLYELLTGVLPFDSQALRSGGLAEIQRIIREVEPTRPSVRLTELARSSGSRNRRLLVQARRVRGDLDRVVMCAIDKDRTRRYESANALGRDIQRYLSDLPVHASKPSTGYRLWKFAKRRRAAAIAISLTLLGVAAGITGLAVGLINARNAQALADRRAENAQVAAAFLQMVLFQVDPEYGGGKLSQLEVMDLASRSVKDLRDHPEVEASVRESIGVAYRRLSMFTKAEPHLRRSLEIRRQLLGDGDLQTARSYIAMAYLLFEHEGSMDGALDYLDKATAIYEANGLSESSAQGWLSLDVGIIELARDHLSAADAAFEQSARLIGAKRGAAHPDISRALRGRAMVALLRGDREGAERLARKAVALCEGEGQTYIGARAKLVLAQVLLESNALDAAAEQLLEAKAQFERTVGALHVRMAEVDALLAEYELRRGAFVESAQIAERCESVLLELVHPQHGALLEARLLRLRARIGLGEAREVDAELLELAAQTERRLGADHPLTVAVARARVDCAKALGDAPLAEIRADRLERLIERRAARLAKETAGSDERDGPQ